MLTRNFCFSAKIPKPGKRVRQDVIIPVTLRFKIRELRTGWQKCWLAQRYLTLRHRITALDSLVVETWRFSHRWWGGVGFGPWGLCSRCITHSRAEPGWVHVTQFTQKAASSLAWTDQVDRLAQVQIRAKKQKEQIQSFHKSALSYFSIPKLPVWLAITRSPRPRFMETKNRIICSVNWFTIHPWLTSTANQPRTYSRIYQGCSCKCFLVLSTGIDLAE